MIYLDICQGAGSAHGDDDDAHFFHLYVKSNVTEEKTRQKIIDLPVKKRAIITNVLKYKGSARLTPKSKVITNVGEFGQVCSTGNSNRGQGFSQKATLLR